MSKILAFVGMMGSGKGTAVSYFTDLGYPHVYFGGFVYEEVEKRGLDRVKDETAVRQNMRDTEGPAVMAKRAEAKADALFAEGKDVVIFDGVYSWAEYLYLHERYGEDIVFIALITDRQKRYDRILARQDGRQYTAEAIKLREKDEIESMNKGGPIAMADRYLDNNGDMASLTEQLDRLKQQLLG